VAQTDALYALSQRERRGEERRERERYTEKENKN
jgi:hypothetical protein